MAQRNRSFQRARILWRSSKREPRPSPTSRGGVSGTLIGDILREGGLRLGILDTFAYTDLTTPFGSARCGALRGSLLGTLWGRAGRLVAVTAIDIDVGDAHGA